MSQREEPSIMNEFPSLCMRCVMQTRNEILSGYTMTDCKCDRCGNVTDLALTKGK